MIFWEVRQENYYALLFQKKIKKIKDTHFLVLYPFLRKNWNVNSIKKKKRDVDFIVNFIFEWQAQQLLHRGCLGRRH